MEATLQDAQIRPAWNIRWAIAVENRDFTDNFQLV
jgi:hypothetical protein